MAEDFEALDALLKASIDSAGAYLRSSFEMPSHSLSARELVSRLDGLRTVAFCTMTKGNEPRVAPVSAFFYRARFYVPSVATSARARQLTRNPASSLTCFSDDWALISHGSTSVIAPTDAQFSKLSQLVQQVGSFDVLDWGEGVFLRFDADVMFTWTRHVEEAAVD
ncbi:MAG: pyridoxamine 5'-phosphate oxidase family protein [Solirubrobacterales bacterium]